MTTTHVYVEALCGGRLRIRALDNMTSLFFRKDKDSWLIYQIREKFSEARNQLINQMTAATLE
jgi:hypothetical protein